jgi:hypothetical protein
VSAAIAEAVRDGRLPGRVWLYSNYHCNLVCTYCLTDSSPKSPRRDHVVRPRRRRQAGDPVSVTRCGPVGPTPTTRISGQHLAAAGSLANFTSGANL